MCLPALNLWLGDSGWGLDKKVFCSRDSHARASLRAERKNKKSRIEDRDQLKWLGHDG